MHVIGAGFGAGKAGEGIASVCHCWQGSDKGEGNKQRKQFYSAHSVLRSPESKSGSALIRYYYVHVPCQATATCQKNWRSHHVENTGSSRKYLRLPCLLYAKV